MDGGEEKRRGGGGLVPYRHLSKWPLYHHPDASRPQPGFLLFPLPSTAFQSIPDLIATVVTSQGRRTLMLKVVMAIDPPLCFLGGIISH